MHGPPREGRPVHAPTCLKEWGPPLPAYATASAAQPQSAAPRAKVRRSRQPTIRPAIPNPRSAIGNPQPAIPNPRSQSAIPDLRSAIRDPRSHSSKRRSPRPAHVRSVAPTSSARLWPRAASQSRHTTRSAPAKRRTSPLDRHSRTDRSWRPSTARSLSRRAACSRCNSPRRRPALGRRSRAFDSRGRTACSA